MQKTFLIFLSTILVFISCDKDDNITDVENPATSLTEVEEIVEPEIEIPLLKSLKGSNWQVYSRSNYITNYFYEGRNLSHINSTNSSSGGEAGQSFWSNSGTYNQYYTYDDLDRILTIEDNYTSESSVDGEISNSRGGTLSK